jgi:hypothetical protein
MAMPMAPAAFCSAFIASLSAPRSFTAGFRRYSSRRSSTPEGSGSGRPPRTQAPDTATGAAVLRNDKATNTRLRGSSACSHLGGGSRRASAGTRMTGARSPTAATRTSRRPSSRMAFA